MVEETCTKDTMGHEALDTWSQRRNHSVPHAPVTPLTGLAGVVQKLISGLDQTKFAKFIDYSHWNGDITIPDGIDGIWTKACDGFQMYAGSGTDKQNYIDKTLRPNIQKAYDKNIPCGVYIYVQPNITDYLISTIVDWHVAVFKEAVKGLRAGVSYHAIALDIEEKNTTSVNALQVVQGIYEALRTDPQFDAVDIFFYTSISVLEYYPALRDWLSYKGSDKLLWLAQWAYVGYKTTWANLLNTIIPGLNMKVLTPGYNTWKALQWGTFNFGDGEIDMNFWKGTPAEYLEAMYYTPRTPADVTPPTAPTGVTAVVSGNTVTVSWNPSMDNVGVVKYLVICNGEQVGETSSTTRIDAGLPAGTYTYQVRAADAGVNLSAMSEAVTVTVEGSGPGEPVDLTAVLAALARIEARLNSIFK